MRIEKVIILFVAVVSFILATPQDGKANLMLVGGGLDDNPIIYPKIVQLAGGNGSNLCILTMMTDNPEEEAAKFVGFFNNWGANSTWVPITYNNQSLSSNDSSNVMLLEGCTGFFLSGGKRESFLDALKFNEFDSLSLKAIRQQLRKGAIVAGNIAGMTTLGSAVTILSDGESYNSLVSQKYSVNDNGGLGIFEFNYMLDAQCSSHGREGRIIRIMYDTQNLPLGVTKGISVDDEQALLIYDIYGPKPTGIVMGTDQGVHIFDISEMISNPSSTTYFEGAKETFLSVDDEIDILSGEVTIASWKNVINTGINPEVIPSSDIFSSNFREDGGLQWLQVLRQLVDARTEKTITSYSYEKSPEFEVTHSRIDGVTVGFKGTSPYGDGVIYSWENMDITIRGL